MLISASNFTDPGCGSRRLHLIDLENLAGRPIFSAVDARTIERIYQNLVGIGPCDLVVVSTSHAAAPASWNSFVPARRLVRSGPDGADLALLNVISAERVPERFNSVVVASGDGIFAEPCARLQSSGCRVTVVSNRRSLSRRLSFAVRDVLYWDQEPAPFLRIAA